VSTNGTTRTATATAEATGTRIRIERPAEHVMRIVLSRPEAHNAQDVRMLYELNDAFDLGAQDDDVKVIVLAADGRNFSAGHDLSEDWPGGPFATEGGAGRAPVGCWGGFTQPGAEGWMATEEEMFLGLCWRWRNLPKPTIAAVQGKVIAAGLMLIWPCDLIVAADDTTFADPVVAFGVNGHEYFTHVWELGARKAKELLFTGRAMTVDEAHMLGMVNKVVAREDLEEATLAMARDVARMPSLGLKLAKQSVNQSLDAQGQWTAIQQAFSLHQVGHGHNRELHGTWALPDGAAVIREFGRSS
jgi:enoyl-CoA hydratase